MSCQEKERKDKHNKNMIKKIDELRPKLGLMILLIILIGWGTIYLIHLKRERALLEQYRFDPGRMRQAKEEILEQNKTNEQLLTQALTKISSAAGSAANTLEIAGGCRWEHVQESIPALQRETGLNLHTIVSQEGRILAYFVSNNGQLTKTVKLIAKCETSWLDADHIEWSKPGELTITYQPFSPGEPAEQEKVQVVE
jgi:hypothetical protein